MGRLGVRLSLAWARWAVDGLCLRVGRGNAPATGPRAHCGIPAAVRC